MSNKFLSSALCVSLSTLLLSACGGSSNDGESSQSFPHVYNVVADSSYLTLVLDDEQSFSRVSFGMTSGMLSVEPDTYNVSLYGIQSSLEIDELEITNDVTELTFSADQRHLLYLTGKYPSVELHNFSYNLDKLNDDEDESKMRLYVGDFKSATGDAGYDVCIAGSAETFDDAVSALPSGKTEPGQVILAGDFDTDTYTIYVATDCADKTSLLFTADEDVIMNSKTAYFLMLRDSHGPSTSGLAMDKVSSASTVVSYEDKTGDAQYRFINTTESDIKISIPETDNETVATAGVSAYKQPQAGNYNYVVFNDANDDGIVDEGEELTARTLLSLSRNTSKTIIVYNANEDDGTQSTKTFKLDDSVRELKYLSHVNFLNLAAGYEPTEDGDKELDIYFTAPGEAIDDNPEYKFLQTDYLQVESDILPANSYTVTVIFDDDGDEVVVTQQDITLEELTSYTLILRKDETSSYGYSILVADSKE